MPQEYRIQINGHLDANWAEWLGGMTLSQQDDGTTLLSGPVVDQPALYGLLAKINSLGLSLISVELVEPEGE